MQSLIYELTKRNIDEPLVMQVQLNKRKCVYRIKLSTAMGVE